MCAHRKETIIITIFLRRVAFLIDNIDDIRQNLNPSTVSMTVNLVGVCVMNTNNVKVIRFTYIFPVPYPRKPEIKINSASISGVGSVTAYVDPERSSARQAAFYVSSGISAFNTKDAAYGDFYFTVTEK